MTDAAQAARTLGRSLRQRSPRSDAGSGLPTRNRDALAILKRQEASRVRALLPIRYGRMSASPFSFLRGAAAVMAADLSPTVVSGIDAQLCGDAHLVNFGIFATPEQRLIFDVNDFDETSPGAWEWDVKRLAASIHVAARTAGMSEAAATNATRASLAGYQRRIRALAGAGTWETWYDHVSIDKLLPLLRGAARRAAQLPAAQALRHDTLTELKQLTVVTDGVRRIIDHPPLVDHAGVNPAQASALSQLLRAHRRTLESDRATLLSRFAAVDIARKVVGVGSVGMRTYIVLLESGDDSLFLEIKQAGVSVLATPGRAGRSRSESERVVTGQRLMQAASDPFLGWARSPVDGDDYYIRQLRDRRVTIAVEDLGPQELTAYSERCGIALARAHARSGVACQIGGYLGGGDAFLAAVVGYARLYADQTERDHAALVSAIRRGTVVAQAGI